MRIINRKISILHTEEYIYKYMSRICGNLLEDKSRLRKDIKKTTENELIKVYMSVPKD